MKNSFFKDKIKTALLATLVITMGLMGCDNKTVKEPEPEITPAVTPGITESEVTDTSEDSNGQEEPYVVYSLIKVDEASTHQVWDSFGASGCWWAQYVGGWDTPNKYSDVPPREAIAKLLFDKEEGLGLTSFRYNLGAGSADSMMGTYSDPHRRAQSFETAPGVYDWNKDANAVWFIEEANRLTEGRIDIILFCNSPLERLTVDGKAQSLKNTRTNIAPENYEAFAKYCFDVAEHFIDEGINVTEISPLNEPQWEWLEGQEGMHLENSEMVAILETFVQKIGEHDKLKNVRISAPESGEWGGKTQSYVTSIMRSDILRNYFTALDCHSYWTDSNTKKVFKKWMNTNFPDIDLRTSEWCEMVNGSDYTMSSAFSIGKVIMEDLKILDVSSWQLWVAVAPGGYRDGVIYVNESAQAYRCPKRYYGYANFTKFIRPGYTRVDISSPYADIYNLNTVAFTGVNDDGKKELVVVIINEENEKTFRMDLNTENTYSKVEVFTTNENRDLECSLNGEYTKNTAITIEGQSIVTLRFTE